MAEDHLPLLARQSPLRRSKVYRAAQENRFTDLSTDQAMTVEKTSTIRPKICSKIHPRLDAMPQMSSRASLGVVLLVYDNAPEKKEPLRFHAKASFGLG